MISHWTRHRFAETVIFLAPQVKNLGYNKDMERKSGLGNEKETSVLLGHLKDLGYEAESRGEITHSAFLGFSLRSFLASYLSHEFSGVGVAEKYVYGSNPMLLP